MKKRLLTLYVLLLTMCSVVCVAASAGLFPIANFAPLALLACLAVLLGNMEIELPSRVSLSLVFAPVFAGILYAGPLAGWALGLLSAVSLQEIRERKSPILLLGNMAQFSLSALAAGWVYVSTGGTLMEMESLAAHQSLSTVVLAPLAATLTFFIVNFALVSVAVKLRTGFKLGEVAHILNPGSYWVSLLVLALLGYIMAYLVYDRSWLGLLVLVVPFLLARRTFRVYAELAEAYTSTVGTLVRAIEAKDPYTRGHSERVAYYAQRLGERMDLSRREADVLERAAVLHDVGKICVPLETLLSAEKLSQEQVEAIRKHPVLGSELMANVEFLNDIVDIVRHHHERWDGAGYPAGLAGEQIPRLARILAVADAYDAMTSDRAYRSRKTAEEANEELRKGSGAQFDEAVVREFMSLLMERECEVAEE